MPIDSLSELRTFVAIVESGSFTAAAQRLGITVNATSRRLQQLEAALGIELIERTTRRSSATDAGQRLLRRAGPILDALLEAEADVQSADAHNDGLVTVALPAIVVSRAFLAELERVLRENAGLRVDLRVGSPHLPGEANVDLAVVVGETRDGASLVRKRIGTHRWGLTASPAYVKRHGAPRDPADLARHACLCFRSDVPQRTWTLTGPKGRRVEVEVEGTVECDDSRVLGDATYAGLGIGVRPERELVEAVGRGELVHVLPGWRFGELPTYLLTTRGRRLLRRVTLVADVIVAGVRGLT